MAAPTPPTASAPAKVWLCKDGCGGVLPRGTQRKYIEAHAPNYARRLTASGLSEISIAAFWGQVRIADNGMCWEWTGRHRNGYGRFKDPVTYRSYYAHRLAHAILRGPVAEGELTLHHSDVAGLGAGCLNPWHTFRGTASNNGLDAASKGFLHRKLRPGNILEMRELHAAGRSMKSLAEQFGVARYAVEMIVRGLAWRHLNGDFVPAPTWRVSPTCRRGHAYDGEYTSPSGVWCRSSICIRLNQDIQTARRRAARKAA
jgi:hypothetical protein